MKVMIIRDPICKNLFHLYGSDIKYYKHYICALPRHFLEILEGEGEARFIDQMDEVDCSIIVELTFNKFMNDIDL